MKTVGQCSAWAVTRPSMPLFFSTTLCGWPFQQVLKKRRRKTSFTAAAKLLKMELEITLPRKKSLLSSLYTPNIDSMTFTGGGGRKSGQEFHLCENTDNILVLHYTFTPLRSKRFHFIGCSVLSGQDCCADLCYGRTTIPLELTLSSGRRKPSQN